MRLVYPGSFDPITYGHIDIIKRGFMLFDNIVVAILDNPAKNLLFSPHERMDMVKEALRSFNPGIEVDIFSGLLAEYVKTKGAGAVLRGLRNPHDYQAEYQYSVYNKQLSGGVETIFLPCSPELSYISSSIVKEAVKFMNEDGRECNAIDEWVPINIKQALRSKFFKG